MERKVGEVFTTGGGRQIEVVELKVDNLYKCKGCYFLSFNGRCLAPIAGAGECIGRFRKDKADVVFKEVK